MPETTPGIAPVATGVYPPQQEIVRQDSPEAKNIPERVATPRESLLLWQQRQTLVDAIKNHSTVILAAGTGTGKTRGGSQIALEAIGPDGKMVVTENLRRTTEESARVVAGDMQVEIGKEVGIRNRYSHEFSDQTKLLFCPVQSLLVMMEDDPLLERYNLVAMDEVHKESKANELCMIRLRDIQTQRKTAGKPELKLMFISATADKEKITAHFPDAYSVDVEGKTYPVDKTFETRDYKPEELPKKAAEKVKSSIAAGDKGDILVFLSGKAQIDEAAKELNGLADVQIIPYYSAASKEEQDSIFAEGGKRRVILATNAAQEGLTIDINIVVDTGMHKHMEMDISTGRQALTEQKAPRDHIIQRMGRIGRKESKYPGQHDKYYALFTEPDFNSRAAHEPAEMQRTDITQEMLILLAQGHDVHTFRYINAPSPTNIDLALKRLTAIGALKDGRLTEKGKLMAELQIRPNLASMMVSATENGAVKKAGALAAMLETYEDALEPRNGTPSTFRNPESDALGFIQIFQTFHNIKSDGERKAWAKKNNLNFWKLRDASRLYDEMLHTLRGKKPGMNLDAEETSFALDRSIYEGFADGYVKLNRDQKHFIEGMGQVEIDKRSALFGKKPKSFITLQLEPQMKDGLITARRAKLNHPVPEDISKPAPAETAKPVPSATVPAPVPAAPVEAPAATTVKPEAPPETPPPPPPKPPTLRERFKSWLSHSIFGKVWRWITK